MIESLYKNFRHWSEKGSVYICSDPHFKDSDCKLMNKDWIEPEVHIEKIKKYCHKNDTLIFLGDIGDIKYLEQAWLPNKRPYLVLIMGNHDETRTKFENLFDEIYEGPLFIGQKLLLSHEPVYGLPWVFNIHGHIHNEDENPREKDTHLNLASNVYNWELLNLGEFIKNGGVSHIKSIHRFTIDKRN